MAATAASQQPISRSVLELPEWMWARRCTHRAEADCGGEGERHLERMENSGNNALSSRPPQDCALRLCFCVKNLIFLTWRLNFASSQNHQKVTICRICFTRYFKIELLSKYNMSISDCFFIQRIIDNLFYIVAVCKSKVLIFFSFFISCSAISPQPSVITSSLHSFDWLGQFGIPGHASPSQSVNLHSHPPRNQRGKCTYGASAAAVLLRLRPFEKRKEKKSWNLIANTKFGRCLIIKIKP